MSQPLYHHLKHTCGFDAVDVLAPAWSEPLLARMPAVRRALVMPLGHGKFGFWRRRQLGRALRKEGYAQAIVLPNSWKSALVPAFAGIPRRTGWRGEFRHGLLNDLRYLDEAALPLMVQRFLALGCDSPGTVPSVNPPRLEVSSGAAMQVAAKFGIAGDRPLLALAPGAEFGPAKCWPAGHFAELARQYRDRGWQIMLLGSDRDTTICAAITADIGACYDLSGKTSLAEAVDLLSLAGAVVSNDSGLMHIAAALGRSLVAVFGATSPDFTPPLDDNARVIKSDLECSPCFQRVCPLGHHRCMQEQEPTQVIAALDDKLALTGRSA